MHQTCQEETEQEIWRHLGYQMNELFHKSIEFVTQCQLLAAKISKQDIFCINYLLVF